MSYWLMKSEPDVFSIDTLINSPKQITSWEGVRNYQARNMIRDQMRVGDLAFFYHSNSNPTGIAGIVEIIKAAYPDSTALDPKNKYYDAKSTPTKPIWYMVDVHFKQKFKQIITLSELKNNSKLQTLAAVKKGNRLSIMPVSKQEWDVILGMN